MVKLARDDSRNPSEFVTAVERGFGVLTAFGRGPTRMTLTQVSEVTNLSRGTARRFLLTLQTLRYVDGDGKMFWLTPKVMQFSGAYLASNGIAEAARPVIWALTESLGESSSVAVLDGLDVVYIVRVETRRIFSSGLDVGSRLPAYCSSLGRALLAGLNEADLNAYLQNAPFEPRTPKTQVTREQLLPRIQETSQAQLCADRRRSGAGRPFDSGADLGCDRPDDRGSQRWDERRAGLAARNEKSNSAASPGCRGIDPIQHTHLGPAHDRL